MDAPLKPQHSPASNPPWLGVKRSCGPTIALEGMALLLPFVYRLTSRLNYETTGS